MPTVEIYTQPWCPFCARAVNLLEKKGILYQEIDAPAGSPAREESIRRANGATSVPQIFIDGQLIGGCDALMALERTNKLNSLLGLH